MRRNQLALICAVLALFGCAKKPKVAVKAKPPKPGWTETGIASWYGYPYHGRRAANGEIYDMEKMTAAHRTLPFGAMVRVTNQNNNKSAEVRITDRGPFVDGRVVDLSKAAARQIELIGPGVAKVKLVLLGYSDKTPPSPAPPPVVLVKSKKPSPLPSPVTAPVSAPLPVTPAAPAPDPSMPDEAAIASSPSSNPASNSSPTLEPPAPDAEVASPATTAATGAPVAPASPAAPPPSASTTASPVTPRPSSPATTVSAPSAPVVPAPASVPSATGPRVPVVSPAPIADPLENGQFAVQVGAFRDRARAEQLQRSLSTRYAPVQLIPRDAGYTVWRVLVGRKNSLEEASALAGVLKPVTGAAFVVRLDQ